MLESPFGSEPVDEVFLPRAPLVRVLSQVRFPKILALLTDEAVAPIQEALKGQYPVLRQEHTVGVLITPEGVTNHEQKETVWRFQSKTGDWQVSLGPTFVALDTDAYLSRGDFCSRLDQVLDVIARVAQPAIAERIGIRYFDRLDDPEQLGRLGALVRPEILGGLAIPLPDGVALGHTLSESLFALPDGQLLARWGLLPPGAVLDPTVPAVAGVSWVLDLDVFNAGRFDFDPAAIGATARRFADQAYRFFRWAVTDDFLRDAGGEL